MLGLNGMADGLDICIFDHTIGQKIMASSSLSEFQSVPIIDVAPLYSGSEAEARAVAAEIRRASIEVGFFYVKGHDVPLALMRDMLSAAKTFFARSEAT